MKADESVCSLSSHRTAGYRKVSLVLEIKDAALTGHKNHQARSSKVSVGINGKEFRRQITSA